MNIGEILIIGLICVIGTILISSNIQRLSTWDDARFCTREFQTSKTLADSSRVIRLKPDCKKILTTKVDEY